MLRIVYSFGSSWLRVLVLCTAHYMWITGLNVNYQNTTFNHGKCNLSAVEGILIHGLYLSYCNFIIFSVFLNVSSSIFVNTVD